MELSQKIDALESVVTELHKGLDIKWCYPRKPLKDPLKAPIKDNWLTWNPSDWTPITPNQENWFYAEVKIPSKSAGINLKGVKADFFIFGWAPFTLWLNGQEQFKETHAWAATGPISDPLPLTLTPGDTINLIMCTEPTDEPKCCPDPLAVKLLPRPCMEMAVELAAAGGQLKLAEQLAKTPREKKLVAQAIATLDVKALNDKKYKPALASIAKMEDILKAFKKKARALELHLIGHSHIDMDWMWTWKDTVHCIRRDFKAVTDMMEDYPELKFNHSQVSTYEVVQDMDPEVFEKTKQRIAEGRWENCAGTWVEGDLHMADGESLARHMLYAHNWTREHLGSESKTLWEPDTFGHPANMPQIAWLGGHENYYHMRCNPGMRDIPGQENNWPVREWVGVDGTPILTVSSRYGDSLQPERTFGSLIQHVKNGLPIAHHVWGLGDHGGGVSRYQMDLLELYRNKPVMPTIKYSTLRDFADAIRESEVELPQNVGETWTEFEGCFTAHAPIKRYNRLGEGALLTAETLCALAGLDRNKKIRENWIPLLFNHFHDIFDGAGVHGTYVDAYARADKAIKNTEKIQKEALKVLMPTVRGGKTLTVLNTQGFARTEPVRVKLPAAAKALQDSDGNLIPVQKIDGEFMFMAKDVPALGRKTYSILIKLPKGFAPASVKVAEDKRPNDKRPNDYASFTVETNAAIAHVRKTSGIIGYYYDKGLQKDIVALGNMRGDSHISRSDMGLNVFQIIDEGPNGMSAWSIHDIQREENLMKNAEVTKLDEGPVFARFKVAHKFRDSKIDEEILFYQDFGRVDFAATVDWNEKGSPEVGVPQLKVAFNAPAKRPTALFDAPYGVTERAVDGMEVPTQKFTHVAGDDGGYTLYNDSKSGADVLGTRSRITIVRNSYAPDGDSDAGIHEVRFAFEPNAAGITQAELVRRGIAYNRPTLGAVTGDKVAGQPAGLAIEGTEAVVITAIARAENSDGLIVRMFEVNGKKATATVSMGDTIKSAQEVNFLEQALADPAEVKGGKVELTFRPYEIKTLLIG